MHEKKSFGQRVEEFLSGKGFYIVLFVCIAVIGVSAWLLVFSRYSPLTPGGAEDYTDVFGDIDTGLEDPYTPAGGEEDGGEPEHDVPAPDTGLTQRPNDPAGDKDSDALTVKDDPPASDAPAQPEDKDGQDVKPTAQDPEDMSFIWPINGEVSLGYSPDALVYSKTMGDWRTHDGIDLAVKLGTKVLSAGSGTVTRVENTDSMGTTVEIDHGSGVVTTYANLAGAPTVKVGDAVTMGSVIGSVGSTALYETGETSHLHFAMSVNGDSVDPAKYLPKKFVEKG